MTRAAVCTSPDWSTYLCMRVTPSDDIPRNTHGHTCTHGRTHPHAHTVFVYLTHFSGVIPRGVRNPMKMSDIGFLKTEPTSKFKNQKLSFRGSVFKKSTSAVWGRFFTLSHSQFILQHDRINSQSIFLHPVSLHF